MNNTGFTKVSATTPKSILFCTEPKISVSIVVTNTGLVADSDGKKILKAGTPITGDLTARNTPFAKETTTETVSNAVAILLEDADVTNGQVNSAALIFGAVDLGKIYTTTAALITPAVKNALSGRIMFCK